MKKSELIALIKETSAPNSDVAALVEAAVAKATAPLATKHSDFMERMLTNREEKKPETLEQRSQKFGRIVRAGAAVTLAMRRGELKSPESVLKEWGDHTLATEIAETRSKAMAAGDAGAGGFLVPVQYSSDVIEFLRAQSIVRRLGSISMPVPTGTIKIPKLTGGATAYYIGENTNATKSEPTTGQLTLSFKKLVTLVPVSNDLIRYSSPGADMLVRNDTVQAMRVREDSAFIRDNGTDSTPKGIRHWAHASHILTQTATVNVQNVFTDLGRLVQKLLEANIPMISPAWMMAPRTEIFLKTLLNSQGIPVFRDEMNGGKLWGFPYGVTTNIPTNLDTSGTGGNDESELYCVDMAQVVIGESMNLQVDASQEAAYHDGSSVQAAYSLDQTVVRAIAEHDLGVRHDKAIAVLTQVDWAPGSV